MSAESDECYCAPEQYRPWDPVQKVDRDNLCAGHYHSGLLHDGTMAAAAILRYMTISSFQGSRRLTLGSCRQASRSIPLSTDSVDKLLVKTQISSPDSGPAPPQKSGPAPPQKLAVAIQGTASDLPAVRAILAHMETRSRVDIFYLAWQVRNPRSVADLGGSARAGQQAWSASRFLKSHPACWRLGRDWST